MKEFLEPEECIGKTIKHVTQRSDGNDIVIVFETNDCLMLRACSQMLYDEVEQEIEYVVLNEDEVVRDKDFMRAAEVIDGKEYAEIERKEEELKKKREADLLAIRQRMEKEQEVKERETYERLKKKYEPNS